MLQIFTLLVIRMFKYLHVCLRASRSFEGHNAKIWCRQSMCSTWRSPIVLKDVVQKGGPRVQTRPYSCLHSGATQGLGNVVKRGVASGVAQLDSTLP